MLHFRNVELAKRYYISEATVRNWIKEAEQGKLNLKLYTLNGHSYVANTARNIAFIEQLIATRKKYRNTKTAKVLAPHPDFYKIYNQQQIYDIITNIEKHYEIPRQYNYFASGAVRWDEYIQRMEQENVPSNLTMTRKLLEKNEAYIDDLLEKYSRVNIVDLGVGNATPVKDFLQHLLKQNKFVRYIAVDISSEMLRIAEQNINKWFGDRIVFEGHECDFSRGRFVDMLTNYHLKDSTSDTRNVMFFLGGILSNFRKRDMLLQVINDNMGANDILIHTQKLDSSIARQQFDFGTPYDEPSLPFLMHSLVLNLLITDPSLYELEVGYDALKRERYERVRLKVSATIKITLNGREYPVDINKGETILLWRASQDSAIDLVKQFDRNDLYLLQTSQTEDKNYILTISQSKRE